MPTATLSDKLVSYLVQDIEGHHFERIVQALLSIRHGHNFEPLGGLKDGGADGLFIGTFSDPTDGKHFLQVSKEENAKIKIIKTVERLRKVGRDVGGLTYWTHRKLPMRDVLEDELGKELKTNIRVRDAASFLDLVNSNPQTIDWFKRNFSEAVHEILRNGSGAKSAGSIFLDDPTVYTYLKFEVSERTDRSSLVIPVVDALIYWALRETNPDTGMLASTAEIKSKIARALPGAANVLVGHVAGRLVVLSKKDKDGHERIRYYRNKDSFCLPHEMRIKLATNSATEELVLVEVLASLSERLREAGLSSGECEKVAVITLDVIYRHFHEQGLALAAFLEKRLERIDFQEQVVEAELQKAFDSELISPKSYGAALHSLRGFFYHPNEIEVKFQKLLSKTSLLLISLKHSPQLIEYFNGMSAKFRLIVGSDILIKAVSEKFLPLQSQTITNLLKSIKEAGATLILTEPVVTEFYTHLYSTHLEFKNHYASREPYLTGAVVSQCDRIFIRTYFHAKQQGLVKGWRSFIENVVDFDLIDSKSPKAELQVRACLEKAFGMDFLADDDLLAGVRSEQLNVLASELRARNAEKHVMLAMNDAALVLSVYAQRRHFKEVSKYDGFGIGTWWLTKETKVLNYTAEIVRSEGTPYIMRPEFLLNFLNLSPKVEISAQSRELLPSHVGLQLGQHLADYQMERLLSAVEEWKDLPRERVEIKVTEFADRLKYDRLKRYQSSLDFDGGSMFDDELKLLRSELNDGRRNEIDLAPEFRTPG